MDTRILHPGKKESGQVLILVALLLVGLIAVLALSLDGGSIYLQRRAMQNAADAGVMAAARVLALNGTTAQAQAAAQEYAVQRNGADSCEVTINGSAITVVAHKNTPMIFGRVLGLNQVTVTARAMANFGAISAADHLAPIAIRDYDYQIGTRTYTIWDDTVDRDPATGNISGSYRGWLNLPCIYPLDCGAGGADDLKEWMRTGWSGMTHVNDWIRGDGGVKAAVIQQAQVGQVLRMVIYDQIEDKYQSNAYYHAIKFAAFRVTRVIATGNPKGIEGMFEYSFTPGSISDGPDGGWRGARLTQ